MKNVLLALLALSLFASPAAAQSRWTFSVDTDDFSDQRSHFAMNILPTQGRGSVSVVCFEDERGLIATVDTGLFVDTADDQWDRKRIRYRIDRETPVETRWPGKGTLSFVMAPDSVTFARALMAGKDRVLIENHNWNNSRRRRSEFSLSGSTDAIGKALRACGH